MRWSDLAEREEAVVKLLPEVLPIVEIPLESLYQCKGDYFKGDGAIRNYGKWLSYGRGILGTSG